MVTSLLSETADVAGSSSPAAASSHVASLNVASVRMSPIAESYTV